MARFGNVHAFSYNSAEREPIWMKPGALFPWPVHSVQETTPNFLRRPTRVDNTSDTVTLTSLSRKQPITIDY